MKIKNIYPTIFALLLIFTIAGCATPSTHDTSKQGQQIYQEQIHITGRISIQYQKDEQEENLHSNFEWQHNKDDINIELSSPLGQTMANITQNAQSASITEAKKPIRTAKDIEQLLLETMDWTIPVKNLKSWLQGFEVGPSQQITPITSIDNTTISSYGWQVRFVTWQESNSLTIPKRIDLSKNTAQMGELKIRIVIDEWK